MIMIVGWQSWSSSWLIECEPIKSLRRSRNYVFGVSNDHEIACKDCRCWLRPRHAYAHATKHYRWLPTIGRVYVRKIWSYGSNVPIHSDNGGVHCLTRNVHSQERCQLRASTEWAIAMQWCRSVSRRRSHPFQKLCREFGRLAIRTPTWGRISKARSETRCRNCRDLKNNASKTDGVK